jgi:hypothetical protein
MPHCDDLVLQSNMYDSHYTQSRQGKAGRPEGKQIVSQGVLYAERPTVMVEIISGKIELNGKNAEGSPNS